MPAGYTAIQPSKPGKHTFQHNVFHLKRNAGHDDVCFIAVILPHTRSRAEVIKQYRAAGKDICLFAVYVEHGTLGATENGFHVGKYIGIPAEATAKISGEGLFGYVVFRGTKTTGDENQVGSARCFAERRDDGFRGVRHRADLPDMDAG